jgi:hypothetical protein
MSNHLSHVADAAQRWPQAWRDAHTNSPRTEDFIRLLASFLHFEVDSNVGLNGKRGNPNDISDDALAVFDPSGDVTDHTGRRMVIIDCIVGAGGPDPQPGWASVGGPSPGAWVQPQRIHDAPAPPPPPPTGGPNATASTTGGTTSDVAARLTAIEGHLMAIARDSAQQTQAQKDIASRMAQLVEAINALKPA